jgi:hypothetical protein
MSIGIHASTAPTMGSAKSAGITPAIVYGSPFIVSARPTADASP